MELCQNIAQLKGVDIGPIGSSLQPKKNREHCVGTGFDPKLKPHDLIKIAYEEDGNNIRPNIIVRGGQEDRAQWYLKYFAEETIDREIEKTRFRHTPHHVMFIITWND